ncbi:unnamed protein product [Urochloa humidicola]
MDEDGKLAAANLPDDVVVEILSRLPVRALCQCKLVSRAWRDVISHPDHRGRLAQPLGFFYHLHVDASSPPIPYWRFAAAAGVDPSVRWFQPPPAYSAADTELLDSCNGLLLLRCCRAPSSSSVYVVCNPAAGNWVELPAPFHAPGAFGLRSDHLLGRRRRTRLAALAFDPAVSPSRFHVLQLVETEYEYYRFVVEAAEIFSSETKAWHLSVSAEWSGHVKCTAHQAAYHDRSVHFAVDEDDDGGAVMSVDVEGDHSWRLTRMIPVCQVTYGGGRFLGRSRGRLLYVHKGAPYYASLSVYSLERRRSAEQWELKHYASPMDQFGKTLFTEHDGVVAVHPDGDVIFLFDACRGMLMAYDMGRRTVRDIQIPLAQASRYYPFFPYVPTYSSEALSSG